MATTINSSTPTTTTTTTTDTTTVDTDTTTTTATTTTITTKFYCYNNYNKTLLIPQEVQLLLIIITINQFQSILFRK